MKLTPKEKAKELFNHYYILIQDIGGELGQEILVSILAKHCSLYFTREMLKDKFILNSKEGYDEYYYWEEVEHEIENYEE
jgi:hypothetical protein